MTNQLNHLLRLRERWIAEYPGLLALDTTHAQHHLEGIADLELFISRLGPEGKDAISGCTGALSDRLTTAHVVVAAHLGRLVLSPR